MAHPMAAGTAPGQRQLNGPQTTGREYRNLSTAEHDMVVQYDVGVPMRDGTVLRADIRRPASGGLFPALLSAAPYPRQLQDLGAPAGVIEAGASDFWVPRGYGHVIANLRGTVGSGGTWGAFDSQERRDLYDLVEWVAAQPGCDGGVGMIGISYYAMTQLAATSQRPPHLRAVFPFDVTVSLREAAYHNGLLSSGFIGPWLNTVGVLSAHGDRVYRGPVANLLRRVFAAPAVHRRFATTGGAAVVRALRLTGRLPHAGRPWNDLWNAVAVDHPTRDVWWAERDLTPLLAGVDIPVYLGSEWSNVPLHLPGAFAAWDALSSNPHVRLSILGEHGLPWPWESMHLEALAWFDLWLKGRETGILDGPPIRYRLPGADGIDGSDGAGGWRTSDVWPPPADHTELALNADASLGGAEHQGARSYATPDLAAPGLPDVIAWTTGPLTADVDVVGHGELQLTASSSATDTAWIALLQDVAPDGSVSDVTQGWLRAGLREVDEAASTLGRPVLPQRRSVPVPPDRPVRYRIPLVPAARRFGRGHRIRLALTSDDTSRNAHAMLNFTHTPVGDDTVNTVYSSSRLLLPVLR
ncbi:CocE/NonD family hydrolase [Jiangella mangrovi]|uniref:Putative acyl esterase n=1 Tax=Jiangella mangrovi TaxID=1524084 RepID=A0A7W9GR52_9ACTN|nr:CocE/NonD family hydrolase [Jiangella mangrovi]MBB5788362.1 putative acyl esterase [Jiangella mangrovi]